MMYKVFAVDFQYPHIGSVRCNRTNYYAIGSPTVFQYPHIGSVRCNSPTEAQPNSCCTTFSTLTSGRFAATRARDCTDAEVDNFQYPHIGSVRCNAATISLIISSQTLSVPSHRVGSLQLALCSGSASYLNEAFSTLTSGRFAATRLRLENASSHSMYFR